MERKVLNKDVQVTKNEVIITESVETRLDQSQLEQKLRDVQIQKSRIKEQNNRLIKDYDTLLQEEIELTELIERLNSDEGVKEI